MFGTRFDALYGHLRSGWSHTNTHHVAEDLPMNEYAKKTVAGAHWPERNPVPGYLGS
jgi:hypothetical protein